MRLGIVSGLVIVQLDGNEVFRTRNLYTNVGYARLANFLAAKSPLPPGYIAVGNGDGSSDGVAITPSASDTRLDFELLRRVATTREVRNTYTARISTVFTASEVQRRLRELGLFDAAGDSGTASSAGSNTLTDASKSWTTDQWGGMEIYITGGTGSGQKRTISSNTASTITVSVNWTTVPDNTSKYTIGGVKAGQAMFARASINVLKGAQAMSVIWELTLPST